MKKARVLPAALVVMALAAAACGGSGSDGGSGSSDLAGTISIDGSSTVFPVSEAVAEEFQLAHPGVRVTVGTSGTGGGFKKFCNGEIDISDASRPIRDEEKTACQAKGIEFVEVKVAIDGLSVVVNPKNDFVECITTGQLRKLWEPNSTVKTWKDLDAKWPAEPIKLYGPGADSGTFDYFTEEIVGESKASRTDFTASEDDNTLVQGVAGDKNALGYFGYAYFAENSAKVKAIGIDGGDGCVTPTDETIEGGTYTPLSRPLYIYPSVEAMQREEVAEFVGFYLENVNDYLSEVGYIPLPEADLAKSAAAVEAATGG